MDKKTYTFMISTNRRGETHSFTVNSAWLKTILFMSLLLSVLIGAAAVDYVGLLLQAGENKRLQAENATLKRQFQVVESQLESLETGLERVKNFSKKLRLITNIDDENRSLKLSVDPNESFGQLTGTDSGSMLDVSGRSGDQSDRSPSAAFLQKDNLFMNAPPLDTKRGELGIEIRRDYATLSIKIDRAVKEAQLREQGILELYESLSERQSLLAATPSIKPARGWFTSRFGYRIDPFTAKPVMHAGLDIAAPPGTPVYAPADGVVSFVGYESGYGKLVSVDHGYGVVTRFAHNSRILVEKGQKVSRREVISTVGNTGRSSGPHLHYEVRVHGVPVDPMNYILDQ
ncbi:MAG: peptidoglycan DD-metalloendopeptidase family protein [Bdellovibrionales bacterium]|nr:peptidoglycan DD-metalloendopeptidase family protein [Bdellovibrionales bacterium]